MKKPSQRAWAAALWAVLCLGSKLPIEKLPLHPLPGDGTEAYFDASLAPFYHGVASGDPLPDAVVIWTRVTAPFRMSVEVGWVLATDEKMENTVAKGTAIATAEHDFTLKIDVRSLEPSTYYYYRFETLGKTSPTGRTKTAATGDLTRCRLAVVSCNNYESGYFNAFACLARRDSIDAVLHLGDYIYEYQPGVFGDRKLGRRHLPARELQSLQDYRTRFAQYRLDPDLREVHRRHPFITVWDDHEIANNAYAGGAENHQPEEGDFQPRKSVARQAYYEWLPVREGATLYRRFSFGQLLDVLMLDERLAGRQAPARKRRKCQIEDATRTMLGEEQFDWLKNKLQNSHATWKIIGNQVIFSELDFLPVFPRAVKNLDAWDGYPAERRHIQDFIFEKQIPNVVFATGDSHCAWAFEVPHRLDDYRLEPHAPLVAHEFATPSISSGNFDEIISRKKTRWVERKLPADGMNPHLKYVNLSEHGYLLLTLTPTEALAEWWFVETLKERRATEYLAKRMTVRATLPAWLAEER